MLVTASASMAQTKRAAQSVRPLNAADVEWMAKAERVGQQLLERYAHTKEVSPSNLDVAFRNWKADSAKRSSDHLVAEGLGVLFGNYVVKHKAASWVVVTDDRGTALAVRSRDGGQIYPIESVWKRIDPQNDDMNFFEPIWSAVVKERFNDR